jgi:hypothetical protein
VKPVFCALVKRPAGFSGVQCTKLARHEFFPTSDDSLFSSRQSTPAVDIGVIFCTSIEAQVWAHDRSSSPSTLTDVVTYFEPESAPADGWARVIGVSTMAFIVV